MDGDAMPIKMDFDLKKFLSSINDQVVMSKDIINFNNGVFAVPNKPKSIEWLNYVNSLRNEKQYSGYWGDQEAMIDTFNDEKWNQIVYQPDYKIGWNSYLPIYNREGDPNLYQKDQSWCLHLPGINSYKKRLELFVKQLPEEFPDGKMPKFYVVNTYGHFGDHIVFTGAARNIIAKHPDIKFIIPDNQFHDIFLYNDDFINYPNRNGIKSAISNYLSLYNEQHAIDGNIVEAFTKSLCKNMGIETVPIITRVPILNLSKEEAEESNQFNGFWLLNANYQTVSISKGYPHWQEVVDELVGKGIKIIQVGNNDRKNITTNLNNVIDIRGQTSIRKLMVMVAGCDGVISPPSCISNIAGAFGTPSVIVNGGREPDKTTEYPNSIHISNHFDFCGWGKDSGCVCLALNGIRKCRHTRKINSKYYCRCMCETKPESIVEAVMSFCQKNSKDSL